MICFRKRTFSEVIRRGNGGLIATCTKDHAAGSLPASFAKLPQQNGEITNAEDDEALRQFRAHRERSEKAAERRCELTA